jgi:hypothetical protein
MITLADETFEDQDHLATTLYWLDFRLQEERLAKLCAAISKWRPRERKDLLRRANFDPDRFRKWARIGRAQLFADASLAPYLRRGLGCFAVLYAISLLTREERYAERDKGYLHKDCTMEAINVFSGR